jgi:hypothetical protein
MEKSILIPDGQGPNGTNRWRMIAKKLPERPPFNRGDKMSGGDTVSPGGVTFCHNGGDTVSPKPSVESSDINHQDSSAATAAASPPPPQKMIQNQQKPQTEEDIELNPIQAASSIESSAAAPLDFSPPPMLNGNGTYKANGTCEPDTAVTDVLEAWGRLFPDKPQPRPATYRAKIKTRLKSEHFRENWLVAMECAAESPSCQAESWFHFEFFIRNDENYVKCLDRWMAWKDKTIKPQVNSKILDATAETARLNAHLPPL